MNENKSLINIIKYKKFININYLFSDRIKIFNSGYTFVYIKDSNQKIIILNNKIVYALDQNKVFISLILK